MEINEKRKLLLTILLLKLFIPLSSGYPLRSSEIFVHFGDYGQTQIYVDRLIRAFETFSYSILVFTIIFGLFFLNSIFFRNSWTNFKSNFSRRRTRNSSDGEKNGDLDI